VIGTTGVGKTRFAELLITQDIHRGDVVIVLDPKGDKELLERIKTEAKNAHRESDVMIFHLGFPKESCRYNPIGHFTKVTQVATRITNALPSTGESAAFKEFAWKYVNLVTRALVAMEIKPTYQIIQFYITRLDDLLIHYCETVMKKLDKKYEVTLTAIIEANTKINKKTGDTKRPSRRQAIFMYAEQYAEKLGQKNILNIANIQTDLFADLISASHTDKTYYNKITASLSPLLEKLCTGEIAELLSPNENDNKDSRQMLDWLSVIKDKKIVYVGMDAMTDQVVSSTVGNAMLSDLVSVAGYLYNFGLDDPNKSLPRICLHADEFNEIIGDEFIPLLNKARGVGFNVVTYTQTWSDVEARLSSTAKAGQVAGNLNVVIMFRTKEAKTVDMLLNQLPTIPILRVIPASSSSDSPQGEDGKYYSSTNEDRFAHADMKLIDQNDILSLPKGHAFCLLEGGKLYKIRVPLSN
jgi:conjugative coupling factor TraD (TOL family)